MPQRTELVEALRCKLQEATECAESDFLRAVTLDVDKLLSSLSVPLVSSRAFSIETEVDAKARALYPEDAPMDMVPLTCKGEGNHLFEAASMLLMGDTSLSMELQLRTMVEMLLHKQYYLKGMIDSKIMLQAARYSLCTEESAEKMNLSMDILEAIFDADVKATCFPGTFTNMWHVYALASVLQSNVYSIYPMSNLKIRPYFNRLICPRTRSLGTELHTLHIMWAGERLSQAVFKPQYFAPIVAVRDLRCQSLDGAESVLPLKTLELLNTDPDISYSVLREKYSITKSTFYRWKRQSREHRQKAATRYEAKHYLQECFASGNFLPLQQFRNRFPEISRSTYYAWKHEMLLAGNGTEGHRPAGEQEFNMNGQPRRTNWSPLSGGSENETTDLSKGACGSGFKPFNGQRSPSMQLAKNFLKECVLLNKCPPYKCFRKSYPWISRSTYYNWRREALNRAGLKVHEANSGFSNATAANREVGVPSPVPNAMGQLAPSGRTGNSPWGHNGVGDGKITISSSSYLQKVRQEEARRRVQKWQIPLSTFRVRYPSISTSTFLWWKGSAAPKRTKVKVMKLHKGGRREISVKPTEDLRHAQAQSDKESSSCSSVTISNCTIPREPTKEPLVVGTLQGVSSKAKAKLFLQRRYVSKNFPTFREFSSYFPMTPRSTYYMWKRALSNGMMLMDC
ncbi:vertnin [Heterodontus francisci]|uniref:vertnin n=1 Tax=Heterodontus francisci TaxID=7792 RepID=UPI00355B6C4C